MKLLAHSWKSGNAKVLVESLDDLWYLHTLIEVGDRVEGHSTRKLAVGGEDSGKTVRKHVYLALVVEKVEFAEFTAQLRVLGTVLEGSADIPHGSHHTLAIAERDTLTISKPRWAQFQIDRLHEACSAETPEVLICILDRDQATFALLKRSGYKVLSRISGEVERKYHAQRAAKDFYTEVGNAIIAYNQRMALANIIVASPAFWKEDFAKTVRDQSVKQKLVLATVSSSDESALREVLLRPEVQRALAKDRISKEQALVEQLLAEIARDGLATYGRAQVAAATEAGMVGTLLITDALIQESRQQGSYLQLEATMRRAEQHGGNVRIISAAHDGGQRLQGLGGMAALLRYRMG